MAQYLLPGGVWVSDDQDSNSLNAAFSVTGFSWLVTTSADVSVWEKATAADQWSAAYSPTISPPSPEAYSLPGIGWFVDINSGDQYQLPGVGWAVTVSLSPSVDEAASAADSWTSSYVGSASLAENASAADAYTQTLTWSVSVSESGSASDTTDGSFSGGSGTSVSATESATAADVWSATLTWSASLSESGSATDQWSETPGGSWSVTLSESAAAADQWTGVFETYFITKLVGAAPVRTTPTRYELFKLVGAAVVTSASVPVPPLTFDPVFPPDLSQGSTGGCGWKTSISVTTSGHEYRQAHWGTSLGRWVAVKRLRTPDAMADTTDLHRLMQGSKGVFRFKDWTDFTVEEGEGFVMFYGSKVVLAKKYSFIDVFGLTHGVLRPIFKPSRFTVVFNQPNVTLEYDTGIVHGASIETTSWTGEFEVPARFDNDQPDVALKQPSGLGWDRIAIAEVRVDPSDL